MQKRTLKKISVGVFTGLLCSWAVACAGDDVEADGGAGEASTGGKSAGGSKNSGGSKNTGGSKASGGSAGEGGDSSGSGGDETGSGGKGTGGSEPLPPAGSGITAESVRVLDNAINPYGATFSKGGYLYVSGTTDVSAVDAAQDSANLRLAVWRFTEDNVLDTGFGTDGVAVSSIVNPGTSYDIIELKDGSLVVQMSGGAHGVALTKLDVSDAAAPSFSAPVSIAWGGWTQAAIDEVSTLCTAAATTLSAVTTAATDGVCDDQSVSYDEDACEVLEGDAEVAEDACVAAWPAATAPAFSQRPSRGSSWGIGLDASGASEKIVVFADASAPKVSTGVQRTDTDRYITRLLASDLSFDTTFNGGAEFSVDFNDKGVNNGSRRGSVEADGSILSAGYNPWDADGNHVHVIRLLPSGQLDPDFGFSDNAGYPWSGGYTHFNPFRAVGGQAEAYNVVPVGGGKYVTTGYGVSHFEASTIENDLVTFRITSEGLDETWGGNAAGDAKFGSFAIQSETDLGAGIGTRPYRENGRDLVALADGRVVEVGCYDDFSAIFVLTKDGKLDDKVGEGTGRIQYTHPYPFFKAAISKDGKRVAALAQSRPKMPTGTAPVYARTVLATLAVDVVE